MILRRWSPQILEVEVGSWFDLTTVSLGVLDHA